MFENSVDLKKMYDKIKEICENGLYWIYIGREVPGVVAVLCVVP